MILLAGSWRLTEEGRGRYETSQTFEGERPKRLSERHLRYALIEPEIAAPRTKGLVLAPPSADLIGLTA